MYILHDVHSVFSTALCSLLLLCLVADSIKFHFTFVVFTYVACVHQLNRFSATGANFLTVETIPPKTVIYFKSFTPKFRVPNILHYYRQITCVKVRNLLHSAFFLLICYKCKKTETMFRLYVSSFRILNLAASNV